MWVQAGFSPETFYVQTPRHFQLAMRGVRKRLGNEAEERTRQAWESGAFSGAAFAGKLKPLKHYTRKSVAQTPREMVAMIQALGSRSNMQIRRVSREG